MFNTMIYSISANCAMKHCGRFFDVVGVVALSALCMTAQASVLGFVEFEGARDSTTAASYFTTQVVQSPDEKNIYTTSLGADPLRTSVLNVFLWDEKIGTLQNIQSVSNTDSIDVGLRNTRGLEISPDGKNIYITGYSGGQFRDAVSWFSRDEGTGQLTYSGRLSEEDLAGEAVSFSDELRIGGDGVFLYVGGGDASGSIHVFKRDEQGALSYVETVRNAQDLSQLRKFALSSDGKNLYAVARNARSLVSFSRDENSGRLTHLATFIASPAESEGGIAGFSAQEDIVVSGDGRFVYATGAIANETVSTTDDKFAILQFSRDLDTGSLTFVDKFENVLVSDDDVETDTLRGARSLALSPNADQKFLYVGAQLADAVNVFKRNTDDGALTWLGWEREGVNGVTVLDSVQDVLVSGDGAYLYVALDEGDGVAVFDSRANLSVVVQDDDDPVQVATAHKYSIVVSNDGPSDAQGVRLTVTLPADQTFVSASVNAVGFTCADDAATVTCEIPILVSASRVVASIEVMAGDTAGVVKTAAAVVADQIDPDLENNTDAEETCVNNAEGNACQASERSEASPAPAEPASPGADSPGETDGGDSGSSGGALGWFALLVLAASLVRNLSNNQCYKCGRRAP